MNQQDIEVTTAYGEAMLYTHLIEDLLRLHLYECAFFRVNNYGPISRKKIKEMDFEDMVNEIGKVYPGSERIVDDLHRVRKIRNHLTHAFVEQVGFDLRTESGRDQIHAMLNRVILHAQRHLKALQKTHETVLREGIKNDFKQILSREEPEFDACIAKSKIRTLLQELDEK
jgi:hypothetical protein